MTRISFAVVIGVLGSAALIGIFVRTSQSPVADVTFVDAPLIVGGANVSLVEAQALPPADGAWLALPLDVAVADGATTTRVHLTQDSTIRVTTDGHAQERAIRVEGAHWLYLTVLALFALAFSLPYMFWPKQPASSSAPWYELLSEAKGGYSLARVQLLLWFLPVAILYAAFSFVTRSFMPVGTQLTVLLGLSGTTTMLGTATSPPTSASSADVAPALSDMVTDWNGHGDLSRYQYLLLSAFGSLVLVAGFLSKLEFPVLPTEFLYLVAASQGTYVATKAVKQAKATAAADANASAAASMSSSPLLAGNAASATSGASTASPPSSNLPASPRAPSEAVRVGASAAGAGGSATADAAV